MGAILKKIGLLRGLLALGVLGILVGMYVVAVMNKPPPRPTTIDAGQDDASLYRLADRPPPPPPVPAILPGRLASDDLAVYMRAVQASGPVERTLAFVNRGQTRIRVEAIEPAGDTAFALVGTTGCGEIETGAPCQARILMSTANAGSPRASLVVRWRLAGPPAGPLEELRISLAGEIEPAGILPALPDIEVPRDWAAERLAAQRRARAEARPGMILGQVPGGAVERGDPVLARRPLAQGAQAGSASQPDYGEDFARRTGSLPVDRTRVVTADRFIEATLVSSINSRLPGEIRASVARNVYGADGRLVLIPARSSLIGRYEGILPSNGSSGSASATAGSGRGLKAGDVRLAVRWSRIIRPDGAHILIDDQGYDAMGRAGLIGEVDNRMFERFFGAALVTTLSVAGSAAQGYIEDGGRQSYQSITSGSSTLLVPNQPSRSAAATRQGMQTAIDRMSSTADQMIRDGLNLDPIITIPQGTLFFVVPKDDIWIPAPEPGAAATTRRVGPPVRRPVPVPAAAFGAPAAGERAAFEPALPPVGPDEEAAR